ncbi:hypothetical protein H2200_010141 [Cladophialophora chaetospira]|uniref:Uncharacterized protein n=1 Tax=Cladophialophora chaetospira TaxID=386627 RepID=A0AA38X2B7_9EURO|nr:hypothetical protein H2200_010141 [Cladophialophora chaetospira]
MNWTGGSLQRHSKANADALVKKQKQHFAKTRLRVQSQHFRPPSSASSLLNDLTRDSLPKKSGSSRPPPQSLAQANVSDRQHNTSPVVRRTAELEHAPSSGRHLSHQAANDEADRQGNHEISWRSIANSDNRQPENVNGVDYARKDLLEKSDWIGLATMRPARFKQTVRDEMDKVGRRRKVTSLKRKRTNPEDGASRKIHRTIQPGPPVPSLQTEDISVRVGSNIHRTQTTPSIFARKDSTQSPGSPTPDPMLVDKADNEPRTRAGGTNTPEDSSPRFQEQAFVARDESATGLAPAATARLVPLEEAVELRLSSWDKVRDYSTQDTTSSAPMLPSDPSFLSSLECDGGVDPGSIASQENKEAVAISFPHGYPSRQPSSPTLPNIIQRGIDVGVVEAAPTKGSPPHVQCRDLYQRSPIATQITSPIAGSARLSEPRLHKSFVLPSIETSPRFTLDAQIELEREVAALERQADHDGSSDLINPSDGLTTSLNAAPSSRGFNTSEERSHSGWIPQNISCTPHDTRANPQKLRDNRVTGSSRRTPSRPPPSTKHLSTVLGLSHDSKKPYSHATSAGDNSAFTSGSNVLDNEGWMKFVFPDNHHEVQGGFKFAANHIQSEPGPARHIAPSTTDEPLSADGPGPSFYIGQRHHDSLSENSNSTESIHTGANTSLFIPPSQNGEPTETDFVSHFSPMAERYARISHCVAKRECLVLR